MELQPDSSTKEALMRYGSNRLRLFKAFSACAALALAVPVLAQDTSDGGKPWSPDMAPAGVSCDATVPASGQVGQTIQFQGSASSTPICSGPGALFEAAPIVGNMRCVPTGTFTQGSDLSDPCRYIDEPQFTHTLTKGMVVMETEVTRQMWANLKAVQASLPNDPTDTLKGAGMNNPVQNCTWYQTIFFANLLSVQRGLTRCYYADAGYTIPIDALNYVGGPVYCNWNADGYRLPSEGEWEYFTRAGTTTAYSVSEPNYGLGVCFSCLPGTVPTALNTVAWWCYNATGVTHAVGQKAANPWNLRDVHGNVREWCWDWVNAYPSGAQSDYHGPLSGSNRAVRGGHWNMTARYCRSANRAYRGPATSDNSTGFRLVRSQD